MIQHSMPLALLGLCCALSALGCQQDASTSAAPASSPAAQAEAPVEDELVVFAAASLRDAFTAVGEDFERAHPGSTITFNFAGTQELRTQVEQGAPADVFASADQRHMEALVTAGRVATPVRFARNELVLVVAREAADRIRAFADLPTCARIVIGAPEVPIGRYTLQVLDRAGPHLGAAFRERVLAHVVSRELNVRQVLTKVRLGEAEAGVVYRTDAISAATTDERNAPSMAVVSIPADINVTAEYPIAVVVGAAHPGLAQQWVQAVLSAEGQAALARYGFLPADSPP